MDIFKYLNSKDITEYLRSIDYKFTSVEAAWIIWHCRSITPAEKYEAWQEIIDTMPDCSSLHSYLKELISQKFDGTDSICAFDYWGINVPTPFKTGDILAYQYNPDKPFVFERRGENEAYKHYICGKGKIRYLEIIENIDLEYYRVELTGKQKVLEKLSTYLSISEDLTCY